MRRRTCHAAAWLLAAWTGAAGAARADEPRARGTDATAPGYPHRTFTAHAFGEGARSFWLFEPAEPRPERAPVVVFHHGWLAVNPGAYGAWIEHLARSGRVVVFPRYQADWTTPPVDFLPNDLAAIRQALDVLDTAPGRVRPDRERFALIGHSAGGNLAVQLAAVAEAASLPRPKAVVAVFPGEVVPLREPGAATLPPETLLVVLAAEQDVVVGDQRARQIFAEATLIPPSRKKFVLYRTDRQALIPLIADHTAPTAALARLDTGEGPFRAWQMRRARVDILDRYGFWRLADLTIEAAFAGKTLDEATRHGAAFADLGRWGDGRLVTPPIVGDDLSTIPRVVPGNGLRLISTDPDDFRQSLERTGP